MARDPNSFRDLHSVYEAEVSRGANLDEARATEDGARTTAAQPYRTEQHHVFAQQYRSEFEREGIDIDRHVVDLDRDNHQSVVHARDEGRANPEWDGFFAASREAGREPTRGEMVEHAQGLMDRNGWNDRDMHAYNDHAQSTSLTELTAEAPPSALAAEVDRDHGVHQAAAPQKDDASASPLAAEVARDSAPAAEAAPTPAVGRDGPDGPSK